MTECNTVHIPAEPGLRLTHKMEPADKDEKVRMSNIPNRQAVGSLMDAHLPSFPISLMQSINSVKIQARHTGKQLRKYSNILHPRKYLDCNSRDPVQTSTLSLPSPTQTMPVILTREDQPQDSCLYSIAELSPGPADVKTASHYLQWNRNILRPATVREKRSGCVV